jgi:acetyl esterase/lipase/Ca2+-binding EF-hand superfamily protein
MMSSLVSPLSILSLILLTSGCYSGRDTHPVGFADRGQMYQSTTASPYNDPARTSRLQARFNHFDRNGDGLLSAQEVERPRLFQRLDLNGDGAVTLEEARGYLQTRRHSPERAASAGALATHDFDEPLSADFEPAADGIGHPTTARTAMRSTPTAPRARSSYSPSSYRSDDDIDGGDDEDMQPASRGLQKSPDRANQRGNRLTERFQRFDQNRDGVLSRNEVQRPELFQRLDQDHNGLVTLDEARRYRNSQRQLAYNERGNTRTDAGGFAPLQMAEGRGFGGRNAGRAFINDAEVNQTRNIQYAQLAGVDPNLLSLDVYAPKTGQNHPVVVMIHGGGWQRGDKANPNVIGNKVRHFVASGYIFASVNYRLSPQFKHPSQVQDIAKAVAWIQDNISRYGGNPNRIYLMGHSSGAHLAALVATDQRHLQAAGKNLQTIKGVILLDGAGYDIPRLMQDHNQPDIYLKAFSNDQKVWEDASPVSHIRTGKGIPPFLVFYTPRPRAQSMAENLQASLQRAGVEVRTKMVNKSHRQINAEVGQSSDQVTSAIMDFIR